MPARYKCPVCGVQLTLNSPPEPRFECPKCDSTVALVPLGAAQQDPTPAQIPTPAQKPAPPRKPLPPQKPVPPQKLNKPAPPPLPAQRQSTPPPPLAPREVAPADAFDLPWEPAPGRALTPAAQLPPDREPSLETPWDNPRFRVRAIIAGLLVLVCLGFIAVYALRKPSGAQQARNTTEKNTDTPSANPAVNPPAPVPGNPSPSVLPPSTPLPTPALPPERKKEPAPIAGPDVSLPPKKDPAIPPVEPMKKSEPPKTVAPPKPPVYDQFGNQVGTEIGLGQHNEFKGQRLLFWGGHTAMPKVFFSPGNPLWKAFEEKGFTVQREFGAFKPEWLKNADQLWILSTSTDDEPSIPLTPELLDMAIKEALARNPPGKRPFGWSDKNLALAEKADLEVGFSPRFPLDEEALNAVEQFVKSGKGLCLLADNEPYTSEANELANRLYGVNVRGNYPGQKIAYIRQRELPAETIRKFKGAYEVDDHPLLTGVNFVYEGITISNVGVGPSEKLDVAMKASDGKPLLVVSTVPGQRVVIDCGYTRYCHGANEETSFIQKTAGTVRLAQNIAAYLAGKGEKK